jgi:hypothetical protein
MLEKPHLHNGRQDSVFTVVLIVPHCRLLRPATSTLRRQPLTCDAFQAPTTTFPCVYRWVCGHTFIPPELSLSFMCSLKQSKASPQAL